LLLADHEPSIEEWPVLVDKARTVPALAARQQLILAFLFDDVETVLRRCECSAEGAQTKRAEAHKNDVAQHTPSMGPR
jgi:hypothetical protein